MLVKKINQQTNKQTNKQTTWYEIALVKLNAVINIFIFIGLESVIKSNSTCLNLSGWKQNETRICPRMSVSNAETHN